MMLSKTTWYAFFVALCFIISESDSSVVDCNSDEEFQSEIGKWSRSKVPVLITKRELFAADNIIIDHFAKHQYQVVIRLYVDGDQCSVANDYFNIRKLYPAVTIVIFNTKYDDVWYFENIRYGLTLEEFTNLAAKGKANHRIKSVTQEMEEGIQKKKRQKAENAATAAVADYWAVAQSYSVAATIYSQQGPSGHWSGYSAGGSSAMRPKSQSPKSQSPKSHSPKSHSPSPPTYLDEPQTLDLFNTPPLGAESSRAERPWLGLDSLNYDPKEKRKASPPQADSWQRRKMIGEFNNQQTQQQAARISQEKKDMGSFLSKRFNTPSPPR